MQFVLVAILLAASASAAPAATHKHAHKTNVTASESASATVSTPTVQGAKPVNLTPLPIEGGRYGHGGARPILEGPIIKEPIFKKPNFNRPTFEEPIAKGPVVDGQATAGLAEMGPVFHARSFIGDLKHFGKDVKGVAVKAGDDVAGVAKKVGSHVVHAGEDVGNAIKGVVNGCHIGNCAAALGPPATSCLGAATEEEDNPVADLSCLANVINVAANKPSACDGCPV